MTAYVSTEKNPQAEIRKELGAETTLLKLHPELGSTKIFVHFKFIDPNYNRTEYWNRLAYWQIKSHYKNNKLLRRPNHRRL